MDHVHFKPLTKKIATQSINFSKYTLGLLLSFLFTWRKFTRAGHMTIIKTKLPSLTPNFPLILILKQNPPILLPHRSQTLISFLCPHHYIPSLNLKGSHQIQMGPNLQCLPPHKG